MNFVTLNNFERTEVRNCGCTVVFVWMIANWGNNLKIEYIPISRYRTYIFKHLEFKYKMSCTYKVLVHFNNSLV